ncbi:glutamyl-tRNA reductase [Nocardioides iriomotensis]|uniref:Glutamyl-tRNA reductase n=1 Tax=Nocardioides iriomotensis TaxID=715784 RepID=A0A4Q5JA89_9ACTN|nr:glutamyl-tRNA reductase [Nocardioides iriomotensis]RYU14899.1 glutamyl-tRNA reductase [Nocardioides iriomotensis]
MSVLVVGVSHRTAPVSVLERLALDREGAGKLVHDVAASEHVTEATVISTCNRVEIYAEVDRFHGSVEAVSRMLCDLADERPEDVVPHLYVHYDDGAVSHLFQVAAGLDSMVVGEGQILGQTREALRIGQEGGTIGPALNTLFQQALRVGKRVHAETDIDRAAPSLVSVSLDRATAHVGPLDGKRVLVVGAGAMAGLAVATVTRAGAGQVVVASRTHAHAVRLAEQYDGRAVPLAEVEAELAAADVLVSCTGATGVVLPLATVAAARADAGGPLAIIDLALPHDVDPTVADLPGVALIDLTRLAAELQEGAISDDVDAVRAVVAEEVTAFVAARRSSAVTPTVVALRTMATGVVEAEMARLASRLPGLDPVVRAEVEHAVRRVADKLLHQPTVRVKELADEAGAVSYATALAELFALDPDAVEAVTRPVVTEEPRLDPTRREESS